MKMYINAYIGLQLYIRVYEQVYVHASKYIDKYKNIPGYKYCIGLFTVKIISTYSCTYTSP